MLHWVELRAEKQKVWQERLAVNAREWLSEEVNPAVLSGPKSIGAPPEDERRGSDQAAGTPVARENSEETATDQREKDPLGELID